MSCRGYQSLTLSCHVMYFPLFDGVLCLSFFCYALLCVHSSFAIILRRKRKLVALLLLSYGCLVIVNVLWPFLTVPWVGLQHVIVAFPGHTHIDAHRKCCIECFLHFYFEAVETKKTLFIPPYVYTFNQLCVKPLLHPEKQVRAVDNIVCLMIALSRLYFLLLFKGKCRVNDPYRCLKEFRRSFRGFILCYFNPWESLCTHNGCN